MNRPSELEHPGPTVDPHQDVIVGGIIPAFEEVEEQVLGAVAHVEIATVRLDGRVAEVLG